MTNTRFLVTISPMYLGMLKKVLGDVKCDRCGREITIGMRVFRSYHMAATTQRAYGKNSRPLWVRCEDCYEKGFIDSQSRPKRCDSS